MPARCAKRCSLNFLHLSKRSTQTRIMVRGTARPVGRLGRCHNQLSTVAGSPAHVNPEGHGAGTPRAGEKRVEGRPKWPYDGAFHDHETLHRLGRIAMRAPRPQLAALTLAAAVALSPVMPDAQAAVVPSAPVGGARAGLRPGPLAHTF